MTWRNKLDEIARLTLAHQPLMALTGAGISVASGIPDFRSQGGLWERFDPFDYASLDSFLSNPARVWTMLRELYLVSVDKCPNAGHFALARLEQAGLLDGIVTQNIDNLHRAAGSLEVIEFHGNGMELECLCCKTTIQTPIGEVTAPLEAFSPPRCSTCRAIMKPKVILFGEMIPTSASRQAQTWAKRCKTMWIIGTSAEVAPASMLPEVAARSGAKIIEINLTPTLLSSDPSCTASLRGPQEEILPALIERILALHRT